MKKSKFLCAAIALALGASAALAQNNRLGHIEKANNIYGKEVLSSDNQKVGNLNNLIIDLESGRVLYATLGLGGGRVGVPPQVFTQTPGQGDNNVHANQTKAYL